MAAKVEDGASTEVAPARASTLHALLHQVLGRSFHRAGADRQMLLAERRVLHPRCVRAEVAAFAFEHCRGDGVAWLRGVEPAEQRRRSTLPQVIEASLGPRACLWRVLTMQRFGDRPDVLTGVIPVDDLRPFAAE